MVLGAEGIQIANNTDLDTITSAGIYYKMSSVDSIINKPNWTTGTGEFMMQVLIYKLSNNTTYGVQTIKTTSGEQFMRTKKDSVWSQWKSFTMI